MSRYDAGPTAEEDNSQDTEQFWPIEATSTVTAAREPATTTRNYSPHGLSDVPAGVRPDGSAVLDTTGKHSAAGNYANVTRAQFYDYERRFMPIEAQLVGLASDSNFVKAGEDIAAQGVDTAFNREFSEGMRDRSRFGLSLKTDEAQSMLRNHALARTGAKTQAVNAARIHGLDRQQALMSGGLGNVLKKSDMVPGG